MHFGGVTGWLARKAKLGPLKSAQLANWIGRVLSRPVVGAPGPGEVLFRPIPLRVQTLILTVSTAEAHTEKGPRST